MLEAESLGAEAGRKNERHSVWIGRYLVADEAEGTSSVQMHVNVVDVVELEGGAISAAHRSGVHVSSGPLSFSSGSTMAATVPMKMSLLQRS